MPRESQEYAGAPDTGISDTRVEEEERELTATGSPEHESEGHESEEHEPEEHESKGPRAQEHWAPRSASDAGAMPMPDSETFSEYQALPEEPPRAIYEQAARPESAAPPAAPPYLSDEEVSSLAEQLAEARHEEVSAQAEADADLGLLEEDSAHSPESAAETDEFIAEADARRTR